MPANTSDQPQPTANIVGALTTDIEVAIDLFDKGVPVWLVCHNSSFPLSSTVLVNQVYPTVDMLIKQDLLPGSAVIWAGPAGAFRNRVCQSLRMGNINLGHTAYEAGPGHFVMVVNQGLSLIYLNSCELYSFPPSQALFCLLRLCQGLSLLHLWRDHQSKPHRRTKCLLQRHLVPFCLLSGPLQFSLTSRFPWINSSPLLPILRLEQIPSGGMPWEQW